MNFVPQIFQTLEHYIFVYLFVWGFLSRSRYFHSYTDVAITIEGLTNLSYARHSWPLNSEGSIAWLTYCDTGHSFIMVICEDPWHSHLLPSVWQWGCHYLFFFLLRSVAAGIRTSNLLLEGRTLRGLHNKEVYEDKFSSSDTSINIMG